MTEQDKTCDLRIWCEECQRCDYITKGDKYYCASCGKLLLPDPNMHIANFTIVTDDKDESS